MLDPELITDTAALEPLVVEWDELAVANRQVFSTPAWMLAWWRHLAPADAAPRVVAVRDGGALVGIAPLFAAPGPGGETYELLGRELGRTSPLAAPAREWEVAEAIGRALAAAPRPPDVLRFDHTPVGPWPPALRAGWPGRRRPVARPQRFTSSPVVLLADGSFDAWFAARSANFRGEMRRLRRRLADAGGRTRLSTPETLAADLETLMRLHAARWEGRGDSFVTPDAPALARAVAEAGRAMPEGRIRLHVTEIDGAAISAQLFLAAGGEAVFFNGGWDEAHARLKPALLGLLDLVEDAFARGDRRIDLGPGAHHYKLRLASGDDPVASAMLVFPSARVLLAAGRRLPALARRAAGARRAN